MFYLYRCSSCKKEIEIQQKMTDSPIERCPNCGNNTLKRIITGGVGVIFKGQGWTKKGPE